MTRAGKRSDGELPLARRLHSNSLHGEIRDGRGDKARGIGEGADRWGGVGGLGEKGGAKSEGGGDYAEFDTEEGRGN